MSVITYLKQCFVPPRVPVAPTEAEQIALKNVVSIAKERLWLLENYPKQPSPSMDYDTNMSLEQSETCEQSIKIVEQYISNFQHIEQPDELRP
mgnify:CR=1 FL=1